MHPRPCERPVPEARDWHEVVRHYERVVEPGKDKAADDLAINCRRLPEPAGRDAGGREGAWYSSEPNSYPLSCKMPANWFGYGEEIHWDTEHSSGPPTARVNASLTTWGDLGNGLLITMWRLLAHSRDVNELNRLDEQARGATHFVGAWAPFNGMRSTWFSSPRPCSSRTSPGLSSCGRSCSPSPGRRSWPAASCSTGDPEDVDGGTVQPVGFEAPQKPHGLAWGETGEGRNPAAWHLDGIYRRLVGGDTDGPTRPRMASPGGHTSRPRRSPWSYATDAQTRVSRWCGSASQPISAPTSRPPPRP